MKDSMLWMWRRNAYGTLLSLLLLLVAARTALGWGALAIDENQGDQYGWSIDYETRELAIARALKECGEGCRVVMIFNGEAAAYVTDQKEGSTIYGWGRASTAQQARQIAIDEARKRGSTIPVVRAWGIESKKYESKGEANADDFWSGKSQQNEPTPTPKPDDFWSGGTSDSPASTDTQKDFWDGSGSVKEEEYFNKTTHPKKSNQYIGEIESPTKYITVRYRDHGKEDGDRVSVLLNRFPYRSDITLTNREQSFKIQLRKGMNRIDFKALNQGSAGPNTAEFKIYDDRGKVISSKEWNILTGFTATLMVVQF